ncbi:GNAT family N-acetyltransferase, partial [Arachnia propionica]
MIRPAVPDDLLRIIEVERAADAMFTTVGLSVVVDAPQTTAEDHAPAQEAGRLLVACAEEHGVVGFIRVDLVDGQAHLEQVSVHPAAAGHGIGAQLMAAAEEWAVDRGLTRVTLCTYRDVPWNAPYYQRLGWEVLPDDALGPELSALRRHERELGLEAQPRQAMVKDLTMSKGTFSQWTPSAEAVGWLQPRNWGHHLPTRDECAKIVRALAGHRWDHMYLAPMAGTLLLHPELFLAGACRPFASAEVIRGAAAAFGVVLDSGLHRPGSVFFRTAPRTELHWGLEGGELVETPTGPAVALNSGYRGDEGWEWLFLSPGGGIPAEVKGVPIQLVDRSSGIDLDAHRAAFEVLLHDGGPGWDPTAPERFVAATGWPLPAAKILLAGMPGLDSCYHNWMPKQIREFLGLKVCEAATAREFLRDLDDGLLVKLVQAGVSDPLRTVRHGLDVDAMVQCWSSNVDDTIALPEDILVEADRSLPYGGRRAANRLTRDGTSLDELRSWLWLASNLPLDNQLRPWLADRLDTMTATSGRATYSQNVWTTSGNRNKLRTIFGLPGFTQVPVGTVAHIGPWHITHCDQHDEVVFKPFDVTDWAMELERTNALDGVLSLDPGALFLAPTVLGQFAPIQEWLRTPGDGWPQDPLASTPDLVTDVQQT